MQNERRFLVVWVLVIIALWGILFAAIFALAHESLIARVHEYNWTTIQITPDLVIAFLSLVFAVFVAWWEFSKRSS